MNVYLIYHHHRPWGFRIMVGGGQLPQWDDLPPMFQKSWNAAAVAVIEAEHNPQEGP